MLNPADLSASVGPALAWVVTWAERRRSSPSPNTRTRRPTVAGYANRVITLQFPDLAEEGDPIWVAIRNPRLQPPEKLRPKDVPLDPETGKPINSDDAVSAMYEIIAGLIIGRRVYDAMVAEVDDQGVPADQPLLVLPATPEKVQHLPMEIIQRISEEMKVGANPR